MLNNVFNIGTIFIGGGGGGGVLTLEWVRVFLRRFPNRTHEWLYHFIHVSNLKKLITGSLLPPIIMHTLSIKI